MVSLVGHDGESKNAGLCDEPLDPIDLALVDLRHNDLDLSITVGSDHDFLCAAGIDPPAQRFDQILGLDPLSTRFFHNAQFSRVDFIDQDCAASEVDSQAGPAIGEHHGAGRKRQQDPAKAGAVIRHLGRFGQVVPDDKGQDQDSQRDGHGQVLVPGDSFAHGTRLRRLCERETVKHQCVE